jgi:hypothetical protein
LTERECETGWRKPTNDALWDRVRRKPDTMVGRN